MEGGVPPGRSTSPACSPLLSTAQRPLLALPCTEDADMDRSALAEFGLEDFSSMLRWAMKEEADEAAAVRRRKRYTGWGRKKASIRCGGLGTVSCCSGNAVVGGRWRGWVWHWLHACCQLAQQAHIGA